MIRKMLALGALAGMMAFTPSASAATRPPENPVCVPLAATIEHWLPILDHAKPGAPARQDAAVAVLDYIPAGRWLNRWVTEAGISFHAEGLGEDFRPQLREGLTHISYLCPSLPASVASGPLPR
jgi:hypothetical protein